MNRLETRIKNLEEVQGDNTDELQPIFLVRKSFDQHSREMESDFMMYDLSLPPPDIPPPPERDPFEPDDAPEKPYLAGYRDEPICMTGDQVRRLVALCTNKSRSIHQVPFSEDERKQMDALRVEVEGNAWLR